MIYKWKQNRFKIDAQTAGEELERIQEKYGDIIPKEVVEESRPDDAVLHNCFEWDDVVAAERFREVQAREVIRNIVIVRSEGQEEYEPVRAFVNVKDSADQSKYITISRAMSNDEYRRQVLQRAMEELRQFKEKYKNLVEFSGVFELIDILDDAI